MSNLLTEQEARQKWCPYTHILEDEHSTRYANRELAPGIVACRCIASDCMAWRWPEGDAEKSTDNEEDYPRVGFCGLAGKP